jgi:predicted tellurium resistance membrane protein TerC
LSWDGFGKTIMRIGCLILVIASAVIATGLMVAASTIYRDLVDGINACQPLESKIREGDNTKILAVLRQHAHTFPESSKRALLVGLGLTGIISFLTFAISAIVCFGSTG